MKTTQILFTTPMVQALQSGTKTQTRRLNGLKNINENPDAWECAATVEGSPAPNVKENSFYAVFVQPGKTAKIKCPYGSPGAVLWVRETFYAYGWWVKEGVEWRFVDFTPEDKDGKYHYEDNPPAEVVLNREANKMGWYKRPSIFMPKAACRIFLKIKSIRVERLQSITEGDAVAEGVLIDDDGYNCYDYLTKDFRFIEPEYSYQTLWQKITGPESWAANPWVWVVEFEKCEKPESFNNVW